MEIEYELTLEDFDAFARPIQEQKTPATSARRNYFGNAIWVVIFALVFVCVISSPDTSGLILGFGAAFLGGLTVGALGMLCFLVVMKRISVSNSARFRDDPRNRWLFEPHRIRIDPERLTIRGSVEQYEIAWSGICQIDATEKWVRFWTTTRTGHVVPRRAFRDQQHFDEFVALARQYQQGWNQPGPKPTSIIAGLPPQSTAIARQDARP